MSVILYFRTHMALSQSTMQEIKCMQKNKLCSSTVTMVLYASRSPKWCQPVKFSDKYFIHVFICCKSPQTILTVLILYITQFTLFHPFSLLTLISIPLLSTFSNIWVWFYYLHLDCVNGLILSNGNVKLEKCYIEISVC
jgi:hypothetical protein